MANAKSFSTSVIITIGIVMGALVATFNLNYQILQAPLPYPSENTLNVIQGNVYNKGQIRTENAASIPSLKEMYRKKYDYFQQQALFTYGEDVLRNLPHSPMLKTAYVTPEFLEILNAPLVLGRKFNMDEGMNSNVPVAIISYNTWMNVFEKNADILNKTLRFNDTSFNIIGVTASNFVEPEIKRKGVETQVWLPWDYNLASPYMRKAWNGISKLHGMLVNIKDTSRIAQISQELTNTYNARYAEELSGRSFFKDKTISFELVTLRTSIVGDSTKLALYLFVGALSITLIATVNVLNLFLSRAAANQKILAIKAALGAQPLTIFQSIFIEVLVLMTIASILSLFLSFGCFELLKIVSLNQLPLLNELTVDLSSVIFSLGCALFLTIVLSLIIHGHIKYKALNCYLQSSGKGTSIQISKLTREALIASQIALTGVILFISLQLFMNSAEYLNKPLDFKIDNLTQVVVNLGTGKDDPINQIQANSLALRKELENHPKVKKASSTYGFPMSATGQLPDRSGWSLQPDKSTQKRSAWISADENYLEILGLEFIAGRNFTYEEVYSKDRVIIINEALERKIDPNGSVLNKMLYWASSPREKKPFKVIGIIKDFELIGKSPPFVFLPSYGGRYPEFLIELQPNQTIDNAELNQIIAKIDNRYKVASQLKMEEAYDILMADETLTVWLSASLAILAVFLAAIGIFGVVSYNVEIRKFELGVRMALGANNRNIYMQMLSNNFKPAACGLAISLPLYASLWFWGDLKTYLSSINVAAWALSVLLIVLLLASTTLLSVWKVLSKKPIYALRNN